MLKNMSFYYMIISEIILLLSAITASIIALIRIIHKSRVSFCRSRCCGNMLDVEERREIDITPELPDNTNNELDNLSTSI